MRKILLTLTISLFRFELHAEPIQCGIPGETFKICNVCADQTTQEMMAFLRPALVNNKHLEAHERWHKIRAQKTISDHLFATLKEKGYILDNTTAQEFTQKHLIRGILSGEDFFYMHRMMLKMVQNEMAVAGLPCMSPWVTLPSRIDDPNWPVPKNFVKGSIEEKRSIKTLSKLIESEAKLKNRDFLKKMSLNRLGEIVESGFHQELHNFYRGNPANSIEAKSQGYQDDLLPVDSSPLNKYFWKLHGLVDELIGKWLEAHDFDEISESCEDRPRCYQWQGTWIGKLHK